MPLVAILGGPPPSDKTMALGRRTSDTMFRCKQKNLSGQAGTGAHGSTRPGDERDRGRVHHTATWGNVLPGKCTNRCSLGHQQRAVVTACVLPVGYGVGDHCLFIVDFVTALLVRTGCSQQIVRPALRCLNTRIAGCALRYIEALRGNILRHRLLELMVAVATSDQPKAEIAKALNKLDKEGEACMKHAEKKCHRLKSGCIPFSPEASLWIRQSQVYHLLLRWHAGMIRHCENLRRTAWRCQINTLFQLTVNDIKLRLCVCKEKCDYFWKHGKRH